MSSTNAAPTPARARLGVSLFFFTNGALIATLLPRYPEVKTAFDLTNTQFGFMVAALPLGSILASGIPAPIIRRFGAARTAVLGTLVMAALLTIAGFAPHAAVFATAIFAVGLMDAVVDSAQNVHGLHTQRWMGRSIINSLHALWSAGATLGGALGAWAGAAGVPLGWHLLASGVVWSAVILGAGILAHVPESERRVVEDPDAHAAASGHRPWLLLLPIVLLATSGTLLEDVANNWSALYLHDVLGAPLGLAGLGFVVMIGSQFVGRLLGDPMSDRWGKPQVARTGGLLAAAGMTLVLVAPAPWVALVGFGLTGFGCATLVPAAFEAAAHIPGLREGTGVTLVGWLMRLGFLVTSPLIGTIADQAGLRAGMVLPLAAGLTAALIAHRTAVRSATG